MSKTLIHVGLHKTGSTYLQKQIFTQSKHRTLLTRPYTTHNKYFNQLMYADDTLYSHSNTMSELSRLPTGGLLLSDETFSGSPLALHSINRSMTARRLSKAFSDAEIILFIRDQADYCVSNYSAYIKMPFGLKRFRDFMHVPKERYEFSDYERGESPKSLNSLYYNTNEFCQSLDGLLYTKLIDLYEGLFSKCHTFLFEDLVAFPEETIERLSEICGEQFQYRSAKENSSLTPRDLVRIRRRNVINTIQNKFLRQLLRPLYKVTPVFLIDDIKRESKELVSDFFTADNQALKTRLGGIDWDRHVGKYM